MSFYVRFTDTTTSFYKGEFAALVRRCFNRSSSLSKFGNIACCACYHFATEVRVKLDTMERFHIDNPTMSGHATDLFDQNITIQF